jgi:hypothetical protein
LKSSSEHDCPQCGAQHHGEYTVFEWDGMTHNLSGMASEAGIYDVVWTPDKVGIKTAGELVVPLSLALSQLQSDPARFKAFNPKNGWGDYAGFVDFISAYLNACREYPDATIRASR